METLPEQPLLRCVCLLVRRYLRHSVGIQSAALAFYLLFAAFPFLIFLSALIGLLRPDTEEILLTLGRFLPREVVALAGRYLAFVQDNAGTRLLVFGLVFSVWFPMRAANTLMRAVRIACRLGPPRRAARHTVKTFVCTVLLMAAVALTLMLMTVGRRALEWAAEHLFLPEAAVRLWILLRFPLAAAMGGLALFLIYALAQDGPRPPRELWPGVLAALAGWLALSWGYSRYVERIADYSLLYGSVGAMAVLLIWLYLSGAVLIMGAELNGVLTGMKKDRAP